MKNNVAAVLLHDLSILIFVNWFCISILVIRSLCSSHSKLAPSTYKNYYAFCFHGNDPAPTSELLWGSCPYRTPWALSRMALTSQPWSMAWLRELTLQMLIYLFMLETRLTK